MRTFLVLLLAAALTCVPAARAAQPLGSQLLLSQAGPDGNAAIDAANSAAAFNPQTGTWLVVWHADEVTDEDYEIWGRFVSRAGEPVGAEFPITAIGGPANSAYHPRPAYNPIANEFVVTFVSDAGADQDFELHAVRVGPTGEARSAVARLSETQGMDHPQVAFNPKRSEYMAVFHGTLPNDTITTVFAVRFKADLTPIGGAFKISNPGGPNANSWASIAYNPRDDEWMAAYILQDGAQYAAVQRMTADGSFVGKHQIVSTAHVHKPMVVHNPDRNEYAVAYPGIRNGETEIYARRVAASGTPTGAELRVSQMGPDGATAYGDATADVTIGYSPQAGEYLALWRGEESTGTFVDGEWEVFGQALNADLGEIGEDDFPVSAMGPAGSTQFRAAQREVLTAPLAHDPQTDSFLVPWWGDPGPPLADEELEVLVRRVGTLASTTPRQEQPPVVAPPAPPAVTPPAVTRPFRNVAWRRRGRLVGILFRGVVRGARIEIRCVDACGRGRKGLVAAVRRARPRKGVTSVRLRRPARRGATLELRVLEPRTIGRYVTVKIGRFAAKKAEGCLGERAVHIACP